MRTRRRPVLQDKTPVNTPQKPKGKAKTTRSAKPKLVPVVEITSRPRRAAKSKHVVNAEPMEVDDAEEVKRHSPIAKKTRKAASKPITRTIRATRSRGNVEVGENRRDAGRDGALVEDSVADVPVTGHEHEEPPADENIEEQQVPRMLPSPVSPTARSHPTRLPLGSLPPSSFPVAQPERAHTPDSIPVADDDSTASEAAGAILATPSPARIIRTPIPVASTPLGRLPALERSLLPFHPTGRHRSSIRKWNAGISRLDSPLPPSSPPLPSPTQGPIASGSQLQPHQYQSSDGPEEDQENSPHAGTMYARRENLSDDDPFGLLAAERKLQAMRARRVPAESSRAPGATRAPLGTLAVDEVPSSVAIPDRLPTPIPSDITEHNIDDLYLDIDPVRPRRSHDDDSDDLEDEDKENVPIDDYDLNEDKENMVPPHLIPENVNDVDDQSMDDVDEDAENLPSVAPLLLASAKKHLGELLEPPSSSDSPTHALRTPHKHRSAHHRSPLPTPHFSDGGLSDSPTMSIAMRNSSPSPVKPSVARFAPSRATRQPLATLELEEPEPPKVVGKKRTRAQVEESSEESDPRAAVRKLEALLPKRAKTARTAVTQAARGRGVTAARSKGKGKERENIPETESESESDVENDSSPPKAPARAARGRGRGRGRGAGRGGGLRGKATAPMSATAGRGRSTSRGRPASKGKGKEKAEDFNAEEDEERARQRQERLEYYRKLKDYSLEKEDVYVI